MKVVLLIFTLIFLCNENRNDYQDFFYYSLDEVIKYEEKNSKGARIYNIYFYKIDTTHKILEYVVGSTNILDELEAKIGCNYFNYRNRLFLISGVESTKYPLIKQDILSLNSVQDCHYSDSLIKLKPKSSYSKDYLSIHIKYENGKVTSYIGNYFPFPLFYKKKSFDEQSKIF